MANMGAAPAELQGNRSPAPDSAVQYGESGIGILGLVQADGSIDGRIEVVDLDPQGFNFTQLRTKTPVEHGWDMDKGDVSAQHAVSLTGVEIDQVKIVSGPDEGDEEHVQFVVSSIEKLGSEVRNAVATEYQGPASGLVGRQVPSQ